MSNRLTVRDIFEIADALQDEIEAGRMDGDRTVFFASQPEHPLVSSIAGWAIVPNAEGSGSNLILTEKPWSLNQMPPEILGPLREQTDWEPQR